MKHRQTGKGAIARSEPEPHRRLVAVGDNVQMAQHHAFGQARCARGKKHKSGAFRVI